MPEFSIVTCSFQQGKYLDATIRSVLDQNHSELEYIVIDGGSTDISNDVIKKYKDRLSWWISERDNGQTDALIKGFSNASGTFQSWLCSDDLLLPGALASVSQFFNAHPDIDVVYGNSLWIDEKGAFIRPKKEIPFFRFPFLFDHNYIPQPSTFWRRRLYDKVGGLDPNFNLAMDADLWERFSSKTRIAHIPIYLSCMRYYPQQKTRSLKTQALLENADIRTRHPLGKYTAAFPLLRLLARLQRISLKMFYGGYFGSVPALTLAALKRYHIESFEE